MASTLPRVCEHEVRVRPYAVALVLDGGLVDESGREGDEPLALLRFRLEDAERPFDEVDVPPPQPCEFAAA